MDNDLFAELVWHLGDRLQPDASLTPDALLDGLRVAEASTTGRQRDLWGFAALNWEAGLGAASGSRPTRDELWATALEYAQLASVAETDLAAAGA